MDKLRVISFIISLMAIGFAMYAIYERRRNHNELLKHIATLHKNK